MCGFWSSVNLKALQVLCGTMKLYETLSVPLLTKWWQAVSSQWWWEWFIVKKKPKLQQTFCNVPYGRNERENRKNKAFVGRSQMMVVSETPKGKSITWANVSMYEHASWRVWRLFLSYFITPNEFFFSFLLKHLEPDVWNWISGTVSWVLHWRFRVQPNIGPYLFFL